MTGVFFRFLLSLVLLYFGPVLDHGIIIQIF